MVKNGRLRLPLNVENATLIQGIICTITLVSLAPKPRGVCQRIFPPEEPGKLQQVQRRGMNSSEHGNGVGQPARAKEKAWEASPGNTKRRGEGRGAYKLANSPAKVNPAPGAFPFAFIPQGEPSLRTSGQGEGTSLQPARSKFRTEPTSQKGSGLGGSLVELRR